MRDVSSYARFLQEERMKTSARLLRQRRRHRVELALVAASVALIFFLSIASLFGWLQ